MHAPSHPLPVTILTGFLGSGKTTILNRALSSEALANSAVLVNELGEIGIDHLLVRHDQEELVLLDSGCVCCTLRADLVRQLVDLLERRELGQVPRFVRVILETTGLADPAPVLSTLLSHPQLSERLYVDGIVATVDAQHGEKTLSSYAEASKQIAVADRVIVTKADLVDEGTLERVEALVRALQPSCELRRSARGSVDPSFLTNIGHLDTRDVLRGEQRPTTGHEHAHHAPHTEVHSIAVTLPRPVDFRAFSLWVAMLTQLQGERILRLKAIVSGRGEPGPIAVQAVQHVVYPPMDLPPIKGLDGRSYVVVLTHGMSQTQLDDVRATLLELAD